MRKSAGRRAAAFLAVVTGVALSLSGCSGNGESGDGDAPSGSASAGREALPPAPAAPEGVVRFQDAEPGSGKGLKAGFTNLTLASSFPQAVQKSVEEQAKIAGLTLMNCDSQANAQKALDCAKQFNTRKAKGLITFQADANAAPRICDAGPKGAPVLAVDIEQKPCQTAFMGAANGYAGELLGYHIGATFKKEYDCAYDAFVSLEALQVGEVNTLRMGGVRKGFESVCGKIKNFRKLDTQGLGGDAAQKLVTDTLTALPGKKRVIVVSINEDSMLGAVAAARAQNRLDDLYLGAQNFDPANCKIYRQPHWVGSVAYFPERYGEILVPYLVKAMRGESVPDQLLVPHEFITKSNAKKFYPSYDC